MTKNNFYLYSAWLMFAVNFGVYLFNTTQKQFWIVSMVFMAAAYIMSHINANKE